MAIPHCSKSNRNINLNAAQNVIRFGRHNRVADEDYYRTLKEFKIARINEK